MRVHAVVLHGTSGASHEFTPERDGTWLLEIQGAFGASPGGRWDTHEVALHVVDAITGTEAA